MPYVVRPMRLEDIDEVCLVERECFTTPWPSHAYRREIRDNRLSHYAVLLRTEGVHGTGHPAPTGVDQSADGDDPLSGVRRAFSQILRPLGLGAPRHHEPRGEEIVGFVGLWLILDEGHITTICVAERHRGHGLGEVLLSYIMSQAEELGARRVTLEVRVSNEVAQSLYRKYGFTVEGVRKRYYSDNSEDAYIMWSDSLPKSEYARRLAELRAGIFKRVGSVTIEKSTENV